MARLTHSKDSGSTVGVWASTADGASAGLVAVDGTGPYVCFYAPKATFPGLALFVNKAGDAMLQLPGPGGKMAGAKQFKVADMLEKLGMLAAEDAEPFAAAAPPEE